MSELHSQLEPFLILARNTKGAAAAKVVLDATAANNIYIFSQLMAVPNIQEIASNPTYEKHNKLLHLFAYGTLSDYISAPDAYPPLTAAHLTKLKHLTLVSLALQRRSLPYSDLATALQVTSTSELENLITDAMYADLLRGKMYHHEQMLHVDWVGGRDVSPADLVKVKAGLETWCTNAKTLLGALDTEIASVRQKAINDAERDALYDRQRDELFLEVRKDKKFDHFANTSSVGGVGDPASGDEEMVRRYADLDSRISSQRSLGEERAKKRAKD